MPLTTKEHRFIRAVEHLKIYLLILALAVLLYLTAAPSEELQMATAVIGASLCLMFWLTQRLLSFITRLDLEMTRLLNAVRRSLTEDERKALFSGRHS